MRGDQFLFWLGASADAEEWRVIPSQPDYEASSLGRIRRGTLIHKGEINRDGYHCVRLRGHRHTTHRLICEAFHGPCPPGKRIAAHSDGNRLNNRPDNLRWATDAENVADAKRHGTFNIRAAVIASCAKDRGGHHNPNAKFSEAEIVRMRELRAEGWSERRLAAEFGCARRTSHRIVSGKSYEGVGA